MLMDKSKHRGKPYLQRVINIMLLIILSVCIFCGLLIFNWFSGFDRYHYQVPILADVDVSYESRYLVEARLLQYVTIGESTREEVETFGDEYLNLEEYSCVLEDIEANSCYDIPIPFELCSYYFLRIIFIFEDNILSEIDFKTDADCLR